MAERRVARAVRIQGRSADVQYVHLRGLRFEDTEPTFPKATETLLRAPVKSHIGFNQVFVNAVRAHNAQHHLVVQGFNTNIDWPCI